MSRVQSLETIPARQIAAALRRADGKVASAAKALGYAENLLWMRIQKDPALVVCLAELRIKR